MAINFPNAPTLDSQFSAGDRTWVWNGTYWEAISTTVGYSGSQGNLGYTGSAGAGFTGSAGTNGYTGSAGSTGTQGNVGFTGSIGSTGTQGNIGFTGSIGSTGTQGNAGFTGSAGSTGTQGNIGFTGSIGYTGSRGIDGVTTTTTIAATIVGTTSTTAGIPGFADKSYTGSLNDGYTLTNGDLYVWKGGDVAGSTATIVEYLIVAGGGAGGYGGGGGGGVLTTSGYVVAAGSPVSLSVGDGGVGATNPGNSTFASFTAIGGGRGGSAGGGPGAAGGSGGGASYDYGNAAAGGGAGTAGQGNRGGHGSSGGGDASAGGGGGAGGIGTGGYANGTNLASGSTGAGGGAGGIGLLSSISGTPTYYGGGGGGGGNINGGNIGNAAPGGLGGGGNGATTAGMPNQAGTDGTANTGGGGGGGDPEVGSANFKRGGSGIVIIRYADTYPVPSATTGSPTVLTTSGYRIYSWTTVGSGSITFANSSPVTGQGWVLAGNIKGTSGYTGSASTATGYTGSIGFTGSAGAGYTGSAGYAGSLGYTGSTGTQGSVGFTGSAGSTGTQGIIGFTGSTGTQGNVGFTGSAGTGYVGSAGSAGSTGPKISLVVVTDSSYNTLDDTAVALTGGYIKIAGSGFESGCQVLLGTTLATSVSYISSTEVRAQLPAASTGTYIIYLVNSDGGTAIRVNAVTFSATPSWTTGAALSGASDTAISIQLAATDATSYSLAAGSSLPSGVTLSSGGLLSGTVTGLSADTTYNFTIIATDAELQDSTRAFTFTITIGDDYFKYVSLLLAGNGTNNSQNNTFLDSSTNNFSITRNGNVPQGTFSPYGSNWSNYFSGTTSFSTPNQAGFNLGTGNFTIEAWVFSISAGTNFGQQVIGKGNGSTGWALLVNRTGNNYGVSATNMDGTALVVYNSTLLPINQWAHIAWVRSSGTAYLYVNGTLISSAADTTNDTNTNTLWVGSQANNGSDQNFPGYISNVRIVKGTAVYTSNFTPPTTPLTAIANTSFLTCQSNRFIDNSINNSAITLTGTLTIQRFSPFSPPTPYSASTIGGSAYFDGTGDYLSAPSDAAFNVSSNNITAEAWVYLTAFNTAGSPNISTIWSLDSSGSQNTFAYIYNTGAIAVGINGVNEIASSAGVIKLGAWYHTAVVRNGSTTTIYVNGVSVASNTTSVWANTGARPFLVGSNTQSATYYLNGYISNVRFVNGTAVYTSAFTPPTAPVTSISGTSILLNFTNAGIIDSAMIGNLETIGDVKITTALSKFGSGSLVFDGTGDRLDIPSNQLFNFSTANFTVEFWLYPSSWTTGAWNTVFSVGQGTANGGLLIGKSDVNTFVIRQYGIASIVSTSTLPTVGVWTHVACVRNSGTSTLYYNGVSIASASDSTNYTSTQLIGHIGNSDGTTYSHYYNGYIDDLRITRGVARYTATFTPPTSAHPLK